MTIEEFIAARLDEDERIAMEANGGHPWHALDLAEEGIGIYAGEDDGDPDAGYSYSPPRTGETRHITRHDPARVLRQVAAVRGVLAALAATQAAENARVDDLAAQGLMTDGMDGDSEYASGRINALAATLVGFAAIWSDHPDYRPEWTPV